MLDLIINGGVPAIRTLLWEKIETNAEQIAFLQIATLTLQQSIHRNYGRPLWSGANISNAADRAGITSMLKVPYLEGPAVLEGYVQYIGFLVSSGYMKFFDVSLSVDKDAALVNIEQFRRLFYLSLAVREAEDEE